MTQAHETSAPSRNQAPQPPRRWFWRTGLGRAAIISAAVVGALVLWENREAIFASDLLLWAPLLLCVGMHFFMHGGHGGHGRHGNRDG